MAPTRTIRLGCLDEFRAMVKALHHAGIEVILDVVYNHTAEGDERGPMLCFRGPENNFYYILGRDKATYADFTGTGNTLKANHSVVKRLILNSLRYWVSEMHVDGFRFDLASIFSRSDTGQPVLNAPIIWEIDSDPVLAGTKLIAEAWDSGGLYQVGSFGRDKWKEWNGVYRDDVRSFLKGDADTVWKLHQRIIGSPDIYKTGGRPTGQSINFITCHDGFTLNDLVSYNSKHNENNRDDNQDGTDNNLSWNCGHLLAVQFLLDKAVTVQIVGGLKRKERSRAHDHRPQLLVADVEVVVCEAASLASQNTVVGIGGGEAGNRGAERLALLHAFENEIHAMPPGPFHAAQGGTHIVLLAHLRLRPFDGDGVVACKRLHPSLILVGPARQHFLADHRLAHYVLEEMNHLPGPGQTAHITVNHHRVKTVVCKQKQAAKQLCKRLHR
jgi:hypothetical protein